jgi:hypothetical protein
MANVLTASYRHGRRPSTLRTRTEIREFLTALVSAGWEFSAAAVYSVDETADDEPGHELIVGVNNATQSGGLRYAGSDGDWYSKGTQVSDHGIQYVYFGTGHDFPADSEIPLTDIERAMGELLTSGGLRPECVTWQQAE